MATTLRQSPPITPVHRETPQKICMGLGWAFILLGLMGFVAPRMFGMHMSFGQDLMYLASGVLTLTFGMSDKIKAVYAFNWVMGAFYGLLGVSGFLFGKLAYSTFATEPYQDRFLFAVVPGTLDFGTSDHILHILVGAIFLVPTLFWRSKQADF